MIVYLAAAIGKLLDFEQNLDFVKFHQTLELCLEIAMRFAQSERNAKLFCKKDLHMGWFA